MTKTSPAGYIVTDNEAIHGVGATADDAWADAIVTLGSAHIAILTDDDDSTEQFGSWMHERDLHIRCASAALIERVRDMGGAIGWSMVGGVACTHDEAEG